MSRPLELYLAIVSAAASVSLGTYSLYVNGALLGEWFTLILLLRVAYVAVYIVLLYLAYKGTDWVRYAISIVFLLGLAVLTQIEVRLLLNVWGLAATSASTLAILFWFLPRTHRWYYDIKHPPPKYDDDDWDDDDDGTGLLPSDLLLKTRLPDDDTR